MSSTSDALTRHIAGRRLEKLTLHSPFVLRTVDPPLDVINGQVVRGVRRIGKRIVLAFDLDDLFLVIHLMIAGRLRWREPGKKSGMGPKPIPRCRLVFEHGTLFFTEASSKKRASMQLVRGEAALRALDPGGLEPLDATLEQFHEALTRENHTLKRALTDPHLFSGIGNAYSDEILHAARLSPLKLTRSLSDAEFARGRRHADDADAVGGSSLRQQTGEGFPEKVTAFRAGMAVHGRFKQPCPVCGSPVQRIVYAANECNYCATCQTNGRLLADRALPGCSRTTGRARSTNADACQSGIATNTYRFIDVKSGVGAYRLLGDEARLRILRVLARERLNVTELTGVLGLAQSGVSRHLGLLKDAGLVEEEKDGGFSYYRAAAPLRREARADGRAILRAQFDDPRRRIRSCGPTKRGSTKSSGFAKRTSTRTPAPTPATRGSSCRAAAGPPGRARWGCCCRRSKWPISAAAKGI